MKWFLCIMLGVLVGTTGVAPLAVGKETSSVETVDLTTWNHPVNKVFEAYKVKVTRLELAQKRTYPIFYVVFPYEIKEENEGSFNALIEQIAQENGYWNYELVDSEHSVVVKVLSDRKKREVTRVLINGSETFFDKAFEESLSKIKSKDQLNALAKGDLNGDKQIEYIVSRENPYGEDILLYVVQWDGKKFVNRGKLRDQIGIVHNLDHVEIAKLDNTKNKYIVVYVNVGMGGYGFSLFRWQSGHSEHLLTNAPMATGRGNRYLEDIDHDGIADSVSEYSYGDTQGHTIYSYHRFDQQQAVKYKVKYENETGKFVHPNTPEGVITNYIEDFYWRNALSGEMKKLVTSSDVLKFKVTDHIYLGMMEYGGLMLEFTTKSNKNGVQVIECKDSYDMEASSKPLQFTMIKQNGLWKINKIEVKG